MGKHTMKKTTEKGYRKLALAEIETVVKLGEHWLATSGFENADHCINRDGACGMGYWELVYTSIASNMEDYNIH
jgi:hypothetical protein